MPFPLAATISINGCFGMKNLSTDSISNLPARVLLPSGNEAVYLTEPRYAKDPDLISMYGVHVATKFSGGWYASTLSGMKPVEDLGTIESLENVALVNARPAVSGMSPGM